MNNVVLKYEDFKFLMEVLNDTISEYAGAKIINELYIPKYKYLEPLLENKN